MRLLLSKEICDNCKNCLEGCPNRLSSLNALRCKHCNPADAKCVEVCEKNAIYEVAEGVLSIDAKLCDGCGKCRETCKEGAIEIINGKARKCDLCAGNNFFISCIRDCKKEAISLIKSRREVKELEEILGWRVFKIAEDAISKLIKSADGYEIVEKGSGERVYCLNQFPELTKQEASLIKEVTNLFRENSNPRANKLNVEKTLLQYCEKNLIELDKEQKGYLLNVLNLLIFGFGPISKLLENDEIEEIAIIGLGKNKPVYIYERTLGWLKTNAYFCNELTVRNLVNKMSRKVGRRLTLQTPKLNAVLPDGSRLNASIPPISFSGPNATIRKFKQKPFTPIDLVENRTISSDALAFLWMALQTDSSLLICGNTGSGKTSSLNALFYLIPKDERIVVTEETPEINMPHEHIVKLNTVEDLRIGMQSLIIDSLRMRPDRIIVGEIRSKEEVGAFIDTLLAGQGRGSYATFHAQSAKETVVRLKSLGVLEIDLASIDLILVQKRWNRIDLRKGIGKELRRVVEIAEVVEKNGKVELSPLYEFNYKRDGLEGMNDSKKIIEKMVKTYNLNKGELTKEINKKRKEIEYLVKQRMGGREFFNYANRRQND